MIKQRIFTFLRLRPFFEEILTTNILYFEAFYDPVLTRFVTSFCRNLALTVCVEPARLSPGASRDNKKKLLLIGPVIGAIVGLMSADTSNKRFSKVLRGAIIGEGLGLVVGSLLDRQ